MKEETKLCRITSPPVFVSKKSQAVLLIRIRIHMFWGLLDPDPLVITYKYRSGSGSGSSSKINKKNLDFYCFVTSLWLFIFEDPLVRGMDPRIRIFIRIRTRMSRIRNTGHKDACVEEFRLSEHQNHINPPCLGIRWKLSKKSFVEALVWVFNIYIKLRSSFCVINRQLFDAENPRMW